MEASKESSTAPAPAPAHAPAPAQQPQCQADKAAEVMAASESSPYVQYKDLEDYKMKGYGSHGHLPVVDPPHRPSGGATDAPTPSPN